MTGSIYNYHQPVLPELLLLHSMTQVPVNTTPEMIKLWEHWLMKPIDDTRKKTTANSFWLNSTLKVSKQDFCRFLSSSTTVFLSTAFFWSSFAYTGVDDKKNMLRDDAILSSRLNLWSREVFACEVWGRKLKAFVDPNPRLVNNNGTEIYSSRVN